MVSVGLCADKKVLEAELSDLAGQQAYLENLWTRIVTEGVQVEQDAIVVWKKADAILKAKKPEAFTCEDKLAIVTAAYYKELLTRMKAELIIVELAMQETRAKIEDVVRRLDAMKKGVGV